MEETRMMRTLLPRNESAFDRAIRIVIGVELLTLVFVGPRTPLGYLGFLPLLTGFLGSCPLYSALGLSTRARSA